MQPRRIPPWGHLLVGALSRTRRPFENLKKFHRSPRPSATSADQRGVAVLRVPPWIKKVLLLDNGANNEPSAAHGDLLAYLHCLDNGRLNRDKGKPSLRKGFSAKS